MAGLFFCLTSAEGAGLLFCQTAIQPHTSLYGGFSAVHAIYTTTTPKAFTGLYSGVPVDLTYSNERNTAATQAAYYNKVYKGAAVCPCYRSMPDSAAYRRPCQPGGLRSGTGQQ